MFRVYKTLFVCFFFLSFGYSGQRMISHISATSGGFTPGIVIANTADSVQNYQLRPYTISGEALPDVIGIIQDGVTRYASLLDLFGREDVSHLVIEGSSSVIVSTTYQSVTESSTPVHVHESAEQSRIWRVYPGDWGVVWDGIAIVNTGADSTRVVIYQKDDQGQILASLEEVTIEPFAKYLTVLSQSFSAFPGSHFEIVSDQPTAVTALRGSHDNRFLWANLAIAQQNAPSVSQTGRYEVLVTSGVKYGEGLTHSDWNSDNSTAMDLLLDIYQPMETQGPHPVIVFIHGGGFIGGSRSAGAAMNLAQYFAARGFVVFSISYRLTGDKGTVPDEYYDYGAGLDLTNSQFDQGMAMYTAGRDAKAAVRWIRANAKTYNLDVSRITAAGGSAGAVTAVSLGVANPEDFRDELSLEDDPTLATTNLEQDDSVHTVVNFWGSAAMMSVLSRAYGYNDRFDATDSPLATIHGTEDPIVLYESALELQTIYNATGAYHELYTLEGAGHSAWSAVYEDKSLYELAFDFIVRMQQITVTP